MTAKEAVFDFLKRERESQPAPDDINIRRREWYDAVKTLMDRLRNWLRDAEHQQLASVEEPVHIIEEDRLGQRIQLPGLKVVTPAGMVVRIKPKARFVAGALGRVDMEAPPKKAILLRTKADEWHFADFASAKQGWTLRELNEETFWETFQDLLS